MGRKFLQCFALCVCFSCSCLYAEDSDPKEEDGPPKIGNLALPSSQQPGGLFAFGANVIDQGQVQLFTFTNEYVGKNKRIINIIPNILFGVTDNLSILFSFPFTPLQQDGNFRSHGFEDFLIQVEYAYYNKSTSTYVDQATILANVGTPTGSLRKNPATGCGTFSFFLGSTFYRTWVDWVVFLSPGVLLTPASHRTKLGDQFLYQCGFGKNIPSPKGWIYAWIIEVDGQYNRRNSTHGTKDLNSGGNTVYITPSAWISSKEMLLQFGISFPIVQNLFGKQRKIDYALNLNFSWSFY